uniref:Uncharacterized protein n=1 Tax=Cacopsylla melanoneura TaxID=428564 RepID=A0A8D9E996_9HEMI
MGSFLLGFKMNLFSASYTTLQHTVFLTNKMGQMNRSFPSSFSDTSFRSSRDIFFRTRRNPRSQVTRGTNNVSTTNHQRSIGLLLSLRPLSMKGSKAESKET